MKGIIRERGLRRSPAVNRPDSVEMLEIIVLKFLIAALSGWLILNLL